MSDTPIVIEMATHMGSGMLEVDIRQHTHRHIQLFRTKKPLFEAPGIYGFHPHPELSRFAGWKIIGEAGQELVVDLLTIPVFDMFLSSCELSVAITDSQLFDDLLEIKILDALSRAHRSSAVALTRSEYVPETFEQVRAALRPPAIAVSTPGDPSALREFSEEVKEEEEVDDEPLVVDHLGLDWH